jgi:hypothetical protein
MYEDQAPQYAPEPPPLSKLAVASLICAFFCQPAGLVLGIVAMVKINGSHGRLGGMGLAIAGTALSGVMTIFLLVLLPIMAAIAIPQLLRSRIGANETYTIGTLKALSVGQQQFRVAGVVDQDQDGVGEYGFLTELGGEAMCRGTEVSVAQAPYITSMFGQTNGFGVVVKSGYCYKLFLPDGRGGALEETYGPPEPSAETADAQEQAYLLYAWPVSRQMGNRTFVIDQNGEIWQLARSKRFGQSNPPAWDEALTDSDGSGKKEFGMDSIGAEGWIAQCR